jgi:ubiquinone/menaquinone biosynthesis C-methylase UbiE
MNAIETAIDNQYGLGGIYDLINTKLVEAGKNSAALEPADLSPVDEFHTRGVESTAELAAMRTFKEGEHILDVGAGLGGTARYLAANHGVRVTGIDLTQEYVDVSRALIDAMGLNDKVDFIQGNALNLPFETEYFDAAWTEHAQMNIADKGKFYSEMARVVKPGGEVILNDIYRGNGKDLLFPVPWADTPDLSHLASELETQQAILNAGLTITNWVENTRDVIDWFKVRMEKMKQDGTPPLGIHLLMGQQAPEKMQNLVRNMEEGRIKVALGMAIKR